MSTNAKPGIGAVLNRWNTVPSTPVWQEIVEVTSLGWGGTSRNVIETFKLNNPDNYVNKLQGVLNAGSVTATINFTQAQLITLKADQETRGSLQYQIVFPNGEGLEWSGFITELPLDLGSDDVMKGDVVFEIDGKVNFLSTATP